MGVAFALFLTPITAIILAMSLIAVVSGGILVTVGVLTKILCNKTKILNMISNIFLIAGFSSLWLITQIKYTEFTIVVCFIAGLIILAKNKEWTLLPLYAIALIIAVIIGTPLIDTLPGLRLMIMFMWLLFCLVKCIHNAFTKRVVKEIYSFILLVEGTITLLLYSIINTVN